MAVLFANNASAALAADINTTATTIALVAGKGALFPAPAAGSYFYATLVNQANDIEIVKCTGRAVDTLTVERGCDGTSARSWLAGDLLEIRVTRAALHDIQAAQPVPAEEEPTPIVGVPTGAIIMWSGLATAIPDGWKLCDGQNGTPDLRGKFIRGSNGTNVGEQGGSTEAFTGPAGAHSHQGTTNVAGSHAHGGATQGHPLAPHEIPGYYPNIYQHGNNYGALAPNSQLGAPHTHGINSDGAHQHDVSLSSASDHVHSMGTMMPPYYTLCYIMKV